MTPLGHAGISLLAAVAIKKTFPALDTTTILSGVVVGGTIIDFDLLYRFYQKGLGVFDKTIGQHHFFPTHTPLFVFILGSAIYLAGFPSFALLFILGALLHLFLLDTLFFPEGINFFYPFKKTTTRFLTIDTHKFWAPKIISQNDGWWKNYTTSPLFWVFEVAPTLVAVVLFLTI